MSVNLRSHDSSRPLWIGVTSRHGSPEWLQQNARNYLAMIASYQAMPVALTPDYPAILPDGNRFAPETEGRLSEAVL
ncbi:MAG TPA: hypothetical protein PL187_20145, partial [Caldilinea sp.]|nr:hypothetical protein [Caldilinea sp.]